MYTSLFKKSSSDEQSGFFFHILATVNSATKNMGVEIFDILSSLLLDIYSEMGLLDHMVVLFFIFKEHPYCFP